MFSFLGLAIVTLAVLGGFAMAGGRFHVLMQPNELVLIGGACLGTLIIAAVGVVLAYVVYLGVSLAFLPSVSDLGNRTTSMTIQVKDWKGNYRPLVVGPKNRYWTPAGSIPPEMKWAVIVAEDDNFYKHEGIDVKAIKNAIKYDLEKKSLARGASTITQQVAKNLFLSREKTITRKLREVLLAWKIEANLTKDEILQLYVNQIFLGQRAYGFAAAAVEICSMAQSFGGQ